MGISSSSAKKNNTDQHVDAGKLILMEKHLGLMKPRGRNNLSILFSRLSPTRIATLLRTDPVDLPSLTKN
jgi:hypothetical protein